MSIQRISLALNELGALAAAGGYRSAARTVYAQLVRYHPGNPVGHVNLGNLLLEDGDVANARPHYQAALDLDPGCPEAHQGLARVLMRTWRACGRDALAARLLRACNHQQTVSWCRVRNSAVLLLVSARGGNIRTAPMDP